MDAVNTVIFTRKLPAGATLDQVAQHVRYIQEHIDFKLKPLIQENADLKRRVEELEGT